MTTPPLLTRQNAVIVDDDDDFQFDCSTLVNSQEFSFNGDIEMMYNDIGNGWGVCNDYSNIPEEERDYSTQSTMTETDGKVEYDCGSDDNVILDIADCEKDSISEFLPLDLLNCCLQDHLQHTGDAVIIHDSPTMDYSLI